MLSVQVLAVFVGQAAESGKEEKGVATNFAVWTRDTKVIHTVKKSFSLQPSPVFFPHW